MTHLSFRWNPISHFPEADRYPEVWTLVEFELKDVPAGTQLRVVESGFDQVPAELRVRSFSDNDEGWTVQLRLIERYLTHPEVAEGR